MSRAVASEASVFPRLGIKNNGDDNITMFRKPFRTPFLKNIDDPNKNDDQDDAEPQPKKRRISSADELEATKTTPRLIFKVPGVSSLPRMPLVGVKNPAKAPEADNGGSEGYYNVLWYIAASEYHRCSP